MPEETQHAEFTIHTLAGNEVLKDIRHLLQRHPLAITGVCDCPVTTTQTDNSKSIPYIIE